MKRLAFTLATLLLTALPALAQISTVYSVSQVDAALAEDGESYVIEVAGSNNTTGWRGHMLVVADYETPPEDGIVDMHVKADAPHIAGMAFTHYRLKTTVDLPEWATGIRVIASTNERVLTLP